MKMTRHTAPALRLRDVAPAAASVVLLLGVAGCMGALGGGPLDGGDGPSPPVTAVEPSPREASPSLLSVEPGEETPQYLFNFADSLAESKRSGAAPEAFTNRKPLFSCGEFVLGQGASMPPAAWDCLAEHLETGAELVEVQPTIEGDPIMSYYRVGPEIDGMEYFNDPTFDKFGADEWTHMVCALAPDDISMSLANCPWDDVE